MKPCYAVVYSSPADHVSKEIYLSKELAEARAKDLNERNVTITGDMLSYSELDDCKYVVNELPLFE